MEIKISYIDKDGDKGLITLYRLRGETTDNFFDRASGHVKSLKEEGCTGITCTEC